MRKLLTCMLGCLLLGSSVFAQKQAEGKVVDEQGKRIPFVSVTIKGKSAGMTADENGEFLLKNVPDNAVIVLSSQGFKTKEVTLAELLKGPIVLEVAVNELKEVIVTTALGVNRTQRSVGYASQQISAEKLSTTKLADLNTALAGKVAGVQVRSGSGAKFGTSTIRLRGVNTLGGGNPIYVIDGVISSASNVNPDDVENINVLKGPAATALYGQRGSEGAIVVTTKKGSRQGIGVEFNHTTTFERVYILPNYQNEYAGGSSQTWNTFVFNPATMPAYLQVLNGAKYHRFDVDESWGPRMDGSLHAPWYAWDPSDPEFGKLKPINPQPDNVKDFFRTGIANNTTVAFSKAGNGSQTRVSFTNLSRSGVVPNSRQQKNWLAFNNTLELGTRLTVNTNINYVYQYLYNVPSEGYGTQTTGSFNQWFQRDVETHKLKRYKRADGTFTSWNISSPTNVAPKYWDNPYTEVYENTSRGYNQALYGSFVASYRLLDGLKINAIVRGNFTNNNGDSRVASYTLNTPRYSTFANKFRETNTLLSADYERNFGEFSFRAAAFGELMKQQAANESAATNGGFILPNVYNVSNSLNEKSASNSQSVRRVNSLYGYISTGFRNMLFVDVNMRNDVSSTLAKGNNSYIYGGVSTSFIFTELLNDKSILSYGKLRASVARVGTDVGAYNTQAVYGLGTNYVKPVGTGTVTYSSQTIPNQRPNANLEPTLSTSYEAGVDLKFFRNRVRLDAGYYFREAKGQILSVSVPGSTGYTSQLINAGNIRNYGFELTLGGTPVRNENLVWDVDFNLGVNRNKVVELAYGIDNIQTGLDGSNVAFGFVGSPAVSLNAKINQPYGMIIGNGIKKDPATGKRLIDDNGFYVTEDNMELGSILPKFTGGFNSSLSYKRFFLSFVVDFQKGGRFISTTKMFNHYSGLAEETAGLNDRGKPKRDPVASGGGVRLDGINQTTGKANDVYVETQDLYEGALFSVWENWMYDASYMKLRELSIGYDLPKTLFGKARIQNARISLIGQNLWLISSKVKGIDPSELEQSWLEGGQLPGTRTMGVNLKITF